MVEVTNFVRLANDSTPMMVDAGLTATTTAGVYDDPGVKVWIRNVGTGLDEWVPLFCPPYCDETEPMSVVADVLSAVTCRAERNRAGGKTLLEVLPTDQYGNLLDPDSVTVTATDASGTANPGAFTDTPELTSPSTKFVWTLKGEGVNTANVSATGNAVTKTGSCTVDTTGIGEPAQVKVVPVDANGKHWGTPVTAWESGDKPAFFLQLVDANGNPTSLRVHRAGPALHRSAEIHRNDGEHRGQDRRGDHLHPRRMVPFVVLLRLRFPMAVQFQPSWRQGSGHVDDRCIGGWRPR